jgi:Chalcone isomerase-like
VHKAALLVVIALLVPMGVMAMTLPDQVAKDFPDLRLAGEGRLRWFGLHVYDASLWINGAGWNEDREFALDIRYARDIKSRRLVQTSLDEMRRLGFGDEQRLEKWAEQMARVLPDVGKGEHLTGVNRPGSGAEFYHQGRIVGTIADPAFARAFFSIWLDARTREPGLRQSLIGSK